MSGLYWIDSSDDESAFPAVETALRDPDGLLAVGGKLTPGRLQAAYRQGIFPWYSVGQPVLWWSPDPRCVLFSERLKVSRSLSKTIRRGTYTVTLDRAFDQVIGACAMPREKDQGTWITPAIQRSYTLLHQMGVAHSVECWQDGRLVGGLYGVAMGRVFFGESMFSHQRDASKVAFAHLVRQLQRWGYPLIDCQVYSPHLASLGAETIPREDFIHLLDQWCDIEVKSVPWQLDADLMDRADVGDGRSPAGE